MDFQSTIQFFLAVLMSLMFTDLIQGNQYPFNPGKACNGRLPDNYEYDNCKGFYKCGAKNSLTTCDGDERYSQTKKKCVLSDNAGECTPDPPEASSGMSSPPFSTPPSPPPLSATPIPRKEASVPPNKIGPTRFDPYVKTSPNVRTIQPSHPAKPVTQHPPSKRSMKSPRFTVFRDKPTPYFPPDMALATKKRKTGKSKGRRHQVVKRGRPTTGYGTSRAPVRRLRK